MNHRFVLTSLPIVLLLFAVIFFAGIQQTRSQADNLPNNIISRDMPLFVEGEAIVVFKTDPSRPDRAEINSLGLNFVNTAGQTDLTQAVMEERIQAREKGISIDPQVVFDTRNLRNTKVRERMERLGTVRAQSFSDSEYSEQFVFGVARSQSSSTEALLAELTDNPEVAYAQPNYLYYQNQAVVEPFAADRENAENLYGVFNNANNAGVRADVVWNQGYTGKGVIVANIDSGVDIDHPDLKPNIFKNTNENCTNNVDDDLNGFIDDCNGWDFRNDDNNPRNNSFPHGTHTSGISVAKKDSSGVVGVAPDATLMPLKVFGSGGSATTLSIVNAIDYAWQNGADVINLSLGSPNISCPTIEHDVIQKAYAAGVFLIASSGNAGPNRPQAPAICQYVLAVGATDANKNVTSYSGSFQDLVDGVAPGHKILSSYPGERYTEQSGTSMSAPHVVGIAALMLEKNPTLSPLQIAETLCDTAEDIGEPGNDTRSGCGFFSAEKAVAAVTAGSADRDCHLINGPADMPDTNDFGVSYDPTSAATENLMKVRCTPNAISATVSGASKKMLVYSKGWVYVNNDWVQVPYSGENLVGDDWYQDEAKLGLSLFATPNQPNYFLSFICLEIDGQYKCGCKKDGTCNNDKWNLQAYQP